jgi:hypothetical protein
MSGMRRRIHVHDRPQPGKKDLRPLGRIRGTGKQDYQIYSAESLKSHLERGPVMKKNPVKLLLAACAGVFLLEKFKGEAEKKYDPAVNTSSSSEEE